MKTKHIYLFILLVSIVQMSFAQSSNQNYILSRTYTNEAGTSYLDQIQYFDGLGRPVQAVQRGLSPSGKDIVSLQEYDHFGRDAENWLPGLSSGNGAYCDPSTIKASARSATMNNDQSPYSKPVYEDSPINRVIAQYAPGADWHNNEKTVRSSYKTNSSGVLYCNLYKARGTNQAPTIYLSSHESSTLYATEIIDEDGNVSYEFKDVLGKVWLTRQIENGQKIDTYYAYNDFGNLCFVLPPRIQEVGVTQNKLDELAYQYKYDHRNRCIWKKIPGCEPIYYIYDKADRLIFSQDGEQRLKGEWQFSIPDAMGRVALTGTCKNNLDYTAAKPLGDYLISVSRSNKNITFKGYDEPYRIVLSTPVIHSVNYYDDYAFLGYNGIPNDANSQYIAEPGYDICYGDHQSANSNKSKGFLTGTLTSQFLPDGTISDTYLYSVVYYDDQGRIVQSKSNNPLAGGYEKEYVAYNFSGQPLKKKHVHSATGKTTQTEVFNYTYDHAGRLTKTMHQLNGGTAIILAENTYDELGRLKTSQKHTHANMKTTYAYNVRSWVKSISSPLFSQTLFYNESYGGNTKRYNGNISAMNWKLSSESYTHGYAFDYDNLSRLTAATYLQNAVANNNYKVQNITYDKHGNMMTIKRYGKINSSAYGLVDNLAMSYSGNQLLSVNDTIGTISIAESADFKNYSNVATEYTYNRNGAMVKDLNKGITEIKYNSLNLPQMMDIKSPVAEARNEYTYSAGGQKLKVVHKWNSNYSTTPVIGSDINTTSLNMTKTTEYIGNKVYENGILKRILVDGGYIEGDVYHFNMKDHLGNNRIVAKADGTVVQKNHYYPFGMAFAETSKAEQEKQPYKYSNKELDQMHGLGWYDLEARYMQSSIGRFNTPDQHAENYFSWSPYCYVGNNPLRRIDPTGMDWYEDEDGNATWQRNQTKAQYKDENGKVWKRTGDTRTVVTSDNQAIVFSQKTDNKGNQTLTSQVFSFGEETVENQTKSNIYFTTAAHLMNASFQSDNSPIPGDKDLKVWTFAASIALYGVIDEGISLFSKTARGNHRDDGLRDWTDEEIAGAIAGLSGQLTKEQKALKQRLTKEQKVRGNRNVQKKGTEKGTGTGRK